MMSRNERSLKINNEKHVEYLFYRFHKELGFEKIIHIQEQFPDLIALKDGCVTRVELEYTLGRIWNHYIVHSSKRSIYRTYYEKSGSKWIVKRQHPLNRELITNVDEIDDEDGNIFWEDTSDIALQSERLRRKSIKPVLDAIVCWKIKSIPNIVENDPHLNELEIIELSSKLEELNLDW